jgi:hypothetical protein
MIHHPTRLEVFLDSINWRRFDLQIGNALGVVFIAIVLYLAYVVVDAFATGAFQRAVR